MGGRLFAVSVAVVYSHADMTLLRSTIHQQTCCSDYDHKIIMSYWNVDMSDDELWIGANSYPDVCTTLLQQKWWRVSLPYTAGNILRFARFAWSFMIRTENHKRIMHISASLGLFLVYFRLSAGHVHKDWSVKKFEFVKVYRGFPASFPGGGDT